MILEGEAEARDWVASVVGPAGVARLSKLIDLLARENAKQNLVSKGSLAAAWVRHIADSVQLLAHVPRGTAEWLDLGTGAGFPGLAIAAARPEIQVTMVESRRRRCEWLESAAESLGLNNARVVFSRLEVFPDQNFDAISARAFAPLEKLLQLAARFSTSSTLWVLPKGRSARQELANLPADVSKMFHVEQSITDPDAGIIVGKGRPERFK